MSPVAEVENALRGTIDTIRQQRLLISAVLGRLERVRAELEPVVRKDGDPVVRDVAARCESALIWLGLASGQLHGMDVGVTAFAELLDMVVPPPAPPTPTGGWRRH